VRAEARAKDFAVEVINHLQTTPYKVFWTLSQLGSRDDSVSTIGLLKSLVFQALRHDPDLLANNVEQLNITRFRTEHTESEWVDVLCLVLSKLSKCFVVVEAEDLFRDLRDQELVKKFLQVFQTIVDKTASSGSLVKILVVSFGRTDPTVPGKNNRIVTAVQPVAPVPPSPETPRDSTKRKELGVAIPSAKILREIGGHCVIPRAPDRCSGEDTFGVFPSLSH
jgi:hypothetical protein